MPESPTVRTQKYFIGANTSRGFINYSDGIFADLKKVYIIKGGPGTGKSTFMKRFALRAEGMGHDTVYYYCSSDPDSLDAVVITDLGIAVTDGTSPHICEASFPGAKEEYLNFGEFWNSEFLALCRDRIEEESRAKGRCFSSLYKYLSIADSVRTERETILLSCYDGGKADKAIGRIMKSIGRGGGFSLIPRQISSFGMKGMTELDTYSSLCENVIAVKDRRGVSPFIFASIIKKAEEAGLMTFVSYDCLCRINAVMLPEKSTCILCLDDGERVINTERFVINSRLTENRRRLRFLRSLEDEIIDCALGELRSAKEHHFMLEGIYREAMDFEALKAMSEKFISEVIK